MIRTKLLQFGEIRVSPNPCILAHSANFRGAFDIDRGPGHKNRAQKRVRTAFLTFPMSSQLFLTNISSSNADV